MTKARVFADIAGAVSNGKIASDDVNVSFENISDTGTEGTKVATGTTAQRGSTTGQIRFNSTTGLAEYYTGTAFKSIDSPPTVSSVGASNITQTQIDSNYDLSITGTGFNSGATVKFIGADNTEYTSPTVTVNSDTSITARVPTTVTNANEPFSVKVTNTSGLSNTLASAFNVDAKPVWQTASGNINNNVEDSSASSTVHATVSATDPEGDTVTYSEVTSTLSGAGFSLNSSNGQITGDPNDVSGDTTVSFNLRATSGTQNTDRSFSMTVKKGLIQSDLIGHYSFKSGDSYSGSGSTVTNLYTGTGALGNGTLYSGGSTGAGTYDSSTGNMGFNLTSASQRQGLLLPVSSTNVSAITIQLLIQWTAQNDGGGRSYIADFRKPGSTGDWYWLFDYGAVGTNESTMNNNGGEARASSPVNWTSAGNYYVHTCLLSNNQTTWRYHTTNGATNANIINSGLSGSNLSNGELFLMGIEPISSTNDYWSRAKLKQVVIYNDLLTESEADANASVLGSRY